MGKFWLRYAQEKRPVHEGDDFVIVDFSDILETEGELPRRPKSGASKFILHHSAGPTDHWLLALERMHRVLVKERGFRGFSYNWFIAYDPPVREEDTTWGGPGRWVILQTQRTDVISAHTRGGNIDGVAAVVQGNFQIGEPSEAQRKLVPLLFDYVKREYDMTNKDIRGHFDYNKPACPGPPFEGWVRMVRTWPENTPLPAIY